jgi:hypothetical protein
MEKYDICFKETNGSKCRYCYNNTSCKYGIDAYNKFLETEQKVQQKKLEKLKRKVVEA